MDSIVDMSQGTGQSNRIGRQAKIYSIHMKGSVTLPAQVTQTTIESFKDVLQLVIILDKQCNGTAPVITQVWKQDKINELRNLEYSKRYKIIYQKYINVRTLVTQNATGDYSNSRNTREFAINIKLRRPIIVDYDGTGGGVSTLTQKNLYVGMVSQLASLQVEGVCRVRFAG